jgi:hypothetical protein
MQAGRTAEQPPPAPLRAFTIQSCLWGHPNRIELKGIWMPSGDQVGKSSSWSVSCTWPDPSAFMTQMWVPRVKAIFAPPGL